MRKNKLPYKLFTSPPSGPDFPACPHNREEVYKALFTSIAGRMKHFTCRFQSTSYPAMPVFPLLQPVAELRRDHRGEFGRQHVNVHDAAASVHV